MKKNRIFHSTWLRLLVITLLVLGVFFRFVNLERKNFWGDETVTLMRIAGYTWAEMEPELYRGREVGIKDFQKYQYLNHKKSIIDTVRGLAEEEPQHPPLYYMLLKFWVQWFGNSVATIRSLSAFLSLLVFPCLYWLCRELFEFQLPGWIAIALVAVSPFHVLYAQEARQYSFWTATILLSSAMLLRAMRLKSQLNWVIYAVTLVIGLYTYLFTVLVAIGHGIYVIAIDHFRLSKTVKAYLLATFSGLLVFLPWLFFVTTNVSQVNSTTSWSYETGWVIGTAGARLSLFAKWARNFSLVFLDTDWERRIIYLGFDNLFTYLIQMLCVLSIVTLAIYSIYFLCRRAPQRTWLFILTLIGVTALALMLPDLIFGGVRSVANRYMIPCYLGIQLAIAYLFGSKITSFSKLWQLVMVALLSLGVLSCVVISQAQTWWTKFDTYHDSQMAQIINQATHPLVVCVGSDASAKALPFSYLLEPKVRFQLVIQPNLPKMSNGFSDVFLYRPSDALLVRLKKERKYKLEPVYKYVKNWLAQQESKILLWRLKRS